MPHKPPFYSPLLDPRIRPQDDLYAYANKGWIKKNPIPASQASWSSFSALHDTVQHQLKALLEGIAKKKKVDRETEKLQAYWQVAMDEKKAEAVGSEPLLEELARIDAIDTKDELPALIAHLHNRGVSVFWDYYIGADDKDNTTNIIQLYQSGLGLPDRDYYLTKDESSEKTRAAYLRTITRLMKLAGWSSKDAAGAATTVMRIETELARNSMTRTELRDIKAQYNKMSLTQLTKKAPSVAWTRYISALGIDLKHASKVIVCQPQFMTASSDLIRKNTLRDIQTYLSWHLIIESAPYLNNAFVQASFDFFGKVISGKKEMQPRWKRALAELDDLVGELVGKAYVAKYFPPTAKKRIDTLIDDLFATYAARIQALPWMSVPTMAKALEKLAAMRRKVGYPTKWRSYADFKPDTDSYLAMHWAGIAYVVRRSIKKLGKPVDRSVWSMTPQTINAYNSFTFNEIVFPAGILQKPFFDAAWPDALNYGGIGTVIGHELTHAFDDMGAQFDKDGNFKNWWGASDKKKFAAEAKKLAAQYSAYHVIDTLNCNGELTLGENIADIGGVAIAYEALARRIGEKAMHVKKNGFTPAQTFFIAYAQSECGSVRPQELRRRVITDPHAPSFLRVNAALPNLQEYHDAFAVQAGDKLYRKPEDRVSIW